MLPKLIYFCTFCCMYTDKFVSLLAITVECKFYLYKCLTIILLYLTYSTSYSQDCGCMCVCNLQQENA